jgi:hypothetical protein
LVLYRWLHLLYLHYLIQYIIKLIIMSATPNNYQYSWYTLQTCSISQTLIDLQLIQPICTTVPSQSTQYMYPCHNLVRPCHLHTYLGIPKVWRETLSYYIRIRVANINPVGWVVHLSTPSHAMVTLYIASNNLCT